MKKDGALAEAGTHEELVDRGGIYHQLWIKQSGVSVGTDGEASVGPEALARMPLLSSLHLGARQELAERFITLTCCAGYELFRAGDPGDAFYVIARGRVRIDVPLVDRNVERVMSEGDSFGEIALLSAAPRTATARAETPCTLLLLLPRASFAQMVAYPGVAVQLREGRGPSGGGPLGVKPRRVSTGRGHRSGGG